MTELIKAVGDSELVGRLGWTLLHTVWLGAAVGAVFALAMLLLRRRSSNARYLAGCAAMILMVAAPAATFFLVHGPDRPVVAAVAATDNAPFARPVNTDVAQPDWSQVAPLKSIPLGVAQAFGPVHPPVANTPWLIAVARALEPALPWVVLAWAAGVLLLSVWQLGGWIAAGRLRRLATLPGEPVLVEQVARLARTLRVSRPVKLLESMLVRVPTVLGWLRPVILLPAGLAAGLTPQQVQAILAHELAHIRRYDYLANLLQTLAETLLFYHPVTWFISRRLRVERENCCDDIAIATGAEPFSYAESLLHVVRQSKKTSRERERAGIPAEALENLGLSARSLTVAARRIHQLTVDRAPGVRATGRASELRDRIGRMLGGEDRNRRALSWPIAVIVLAALAGSALLVSCGLQSHNPVIPPAATQPASQPQSDWDVKIQGQFYQLPEESQAALMKWMNKNMAGKFDEKTGIAILNAEQADLLAKGMESEIQQVRGSRTLIIPWITCHDAKPAEVFVGAKYGVQLPLLDDKGGRKVSAPIVRGQTLKVRPVISADRKYVTLDLAARQNWINLVDKKNSLWKRLFDKAPETELVTAEPALETVIGREASVSVPDGGAVLLHLPVTCRRIDGIRRAKDKPDQAWDVQYTPVKIGQTKGYQCAVIYENHGLFSTSTTTKYVTYFVYVLVRPAIKLNSVEASPATHTSTTQPAGRVTLASTSEIGAELLVYDKGAARGRSIHYQYIMPEAQQRRVLREAPRLRVGDTVQDVVRRLGPPLQDEVLCGKEANRPFVARSLSYYFAQRNLESANNFDPCIQLFFDARNRLERMASDVDAIPSLNWTPRQEIPLESAPTSRQANHPVAPAATQPTAAKEVKTLMGRWPWNTRYGIVVQVNSGKIQSAKAVEYSKHNAIVEVPHTAFAEAGSIDIIFEEYLERENATVIGLAKYSISKSVIVRDGKVFALVSGREVELREMPDKLNAAHLAKEVDWGKPVNGIQARLRLDKTTWKQGETPSFKTDIRNNGTSSKYRFVQDQRSFELVLDGATYRYWGGLSHQSNRVLPSGGQYNGIPIVLEKSWCLDRQLQGQTSPLVLTPGKHTLAVRLFRFFNDESAYKEMIVETNPVEFEVASSATAQSAADSPLRRVKLTVDMTRWDAEQLIAQATGTKSKYDLINKAMITSNECVYRDGNTVLVIHYRPGMPLEKVINTADSHDVHWLGPTDGAVLSWEYLTPTASATAPATQPEERLRSRLMEALPTNWRLAQMAHDKVAPTQWPEGLGWLAILERKGTPAADYKHGLGGEVLVWIMDEGYTAKTTLYGNGSQEPPARAINPWRGRRVFLWGGGGKDWKDWQSDVLRELKSTDTLPIATQPVELTKTKDWAIIEDVWKSVSPAAMNDKNNPFNDLTNKSATNNRRFSIIADANKAAYNLAGVGLLERAEADLLKIELETGPTSEEVIQMRAKAEQSSVMNPVWRALSQLENRQTSFHDLAVGGKAHAEVLVKVLPTIVTDLLLLGDLGNNINDLQFRARVVKIRAEMADDLRKIIQSTLPAAAPAYHPVDGKLVAELVRQLGDENSQVRDKAIKKLVALGPAVSRLLDAKRRDSKLDPEIVARIQIVLEKTNLIWLSDLASSAKARKLVAKLSNSDIKWHGTYVGLMPEIVGQPAKDILDLGRPARTSLLAVLKDKDKFAAAHVLLTKIAESEPGFSYETSAAEWNGLRVKLTADNRTVFYPEQIPTLVKKWQSVVATQPASAPAPITENVYENRR